MTTLQELALAPAAGPLPARARRLLSDAAGRIEAYYAARPQRTGHGFVPSDYPTVYRALDALRRQDPDLRRLCEWGSGFGVVAGLAALLGFEAYGIEVEPELVSASRSLLADHDLQAEIAAGSFVPDDYAQRDALWDVESRTVLTAAAAYDQLDLAVDDLDVVFAYPWPTEQERFRDMFGRYADYGAVLVTHSLEDGVRAFRKVAAAP